MVLFQEGNHGTPPGFRRGTERNPLLFKKGVGGGQRWAIPLGETAPAGVSLPWELSIAQIAANTMYLSRRVWMRHPGTCVTRWDCR